MATEGLCELPDWQAPAGGRVVWLEDNVGPKLRAAVWHPGNTGPRAVNGSVFLFTGRTEYIEKYYEVIGEFLERGFAVAVLDWRGQGLSARALADPRKGYVRDFGEFETDLQRFLSALAPEMPEPHVALAHSMGGNVLLRAAPKWPASFRAVMLSAPMLGLPFGGFWGEALIGFAIWAADTLGLGACYLPGGTGKAVDELPFEENNVTSDLVRYTKQQELVARFPDLGLGSATVRWLRAAMQAIDEVTEPDFLAGVELPVLILQAERDRIVLNEAQTYAAEAIDHGELETMHGSNHEPMLENDHVRADFWRTVDLFLERQLGVNLSRG